MVNWDEIRDKFPATKKFTYLNAASVSPSSKEATEAGRQFYDEVLISGDSNWEEWLSKMEKVRAKVAKLINADKDEIAFIPNTSVGMNFVAQILKRMGEIVTMDDEFPSSTLPWINQGFKLNFVKPKNNSYSVDMIDKEVDEKTKILLTCHVQPFTGFKQDLVEVGNYCKSKSLIFVVNATQSIGVIPINVKKANIDFLVFSSVKWLMTGVHIGALYINRKWLKGIKWPMVGWLSVKDPYKFDNKNADLKNDASVLELGGPSFHSIFVLGKAIDLINTIGVKNIEKRLNKLTDYLNGRLEELGLKIISPRDRKFRCSITIVEIEKAKEIAKKLFQKSIVTSERKGRLRISLHIFNNKEDIDTLISKLDSIDSLCQARV